MQTPNTPGPTVTLTPGLCGEGFVVTVTPDNDDAPVRVATVNLCGGVVVEEVGDDPRVDHAVVLTAARLAGEAATLSSILAGHLTSADLGEPILSRDVPGHGETFIPAAVERTIRRPAPACPRCDDTGTIAEREPVGDGTVTHTWPCSCWAAAPGHPDRLRPTSPTGDVYHCAASISGTTDDVDAYVHLPYATPDGPTDADREYPVAGDVDARAFLLSGGVRGAIWSHTATGDYDVDPESGSPDFAYVWQLDGGTQADAGTAAILDAAFADVDEQYQRFLEADARMGDPNP